SLSASLRKTNDLIEKWSAGPKEVLATFTNSPYCPEFPSSELKNIITGKPVNMDAVFSGFYSAQPDNKIKETVGDFEIMFGRPEVSKSIKTGSDWNIAWGYTEDAYRFLFPHRSSELSRYRTYISQTFSTATPEFHFRVITFDKSVRKCVGLCRKYEFTDFSEFENLRSAHFSPSTKKPTKSLSNRILSSRKDYCHKWNAGTCTRSAEVCRYSHICSTCGGKYKQKDC
ncbi:hypothetical protein BJ138DRAFT_974409, partial [Hygrophoropsis aurantiaca]